jgi:hypothetical protein
LELNSEGTDYAALPPQAANPHDLMLLELIRVMFGRRYASTWWIPFRERWIAE